MRPANLFPALLTLMATDLLTAPCATADTGRGEINQACALSGCFPGDAPGFPVTIGAPGSYVLTGNLDLASDPLAQTAIVISTPGAWIDFNGYVLTGSATCSGSGVTLDCLPARVDVPGVRIEQAADGATLRNGTIRGFAGHGVESFARATRVSGLVLRHNVGNGVLAQAQAQVSAIVAFENFGHGIQVGPHSRVDNTTAFANHVDGIRTLAPGSVVAGNTATGNGASGFTLGPRTRYTDNVSLDNVGVDSCGNGLCSPLRRYYLTVAEVNGAGPLAACAAGFHMAHLWEIRDPSNLAYDIVLGRTEDDSGSGPIAASLGWVRTGWNARGDSIPGVGNCDAWTSDVDGNGSVARLRQSWNATLDPDEPSNPWFSDVRPCHNEFPAWCVED